MVGIEQNIIKTITPCRNSAIAKRKERISHGQFQRKLITLGVISLNSIQHSYNIGRNTTANSKGGGNDKKLIVSSRYVPDKFHNRLISKRGRTSTRYSTCVHQPLFTDIAIKSNPSLYIFHLISGFKTSQIRKPL